MTRVRDNSCPRDYLVRRVKFPCTSRDVTSYGYERGAGVDGR